MKGSTNNPSMAIDGTCDICGNHVDNCDGDRCGECGNWACYECGTHFDKGWLCPSCAEAAQLEAEGADEDEEEPSYFELATGISKQKLLADLEKLTIRHEAKERDLEEARGK